MISILGYSWRNVLGEFDIRDNGINYHAIIGYTQEDLKNEQLYLRLFIDDKFIRGGWLKTWIEMDHPTFCPISYSLNEKCVALLNKLD